MEEAEHIQVDTAVIERDKVAAGEQVQVDMVDRVASGQVDMEEAVVRKLLSEVYSGHWVPY